MRTLLSVSPLPSSSQKWHVQDLMGVITSDWRSDLSQALMEAQGVPNYIRHFPSSCKDLSSKTWTICVGFYLFFHVWCVFYVYLSSDIMWLVIWGLFFFFPPFHWLIFYLLEGRQDCGVNNHFVFYSTVLGRTMWSTILGSQQTLNRI